MADVFISYNSKEYAEAGWVRSVLEQNGISCWMAPENIPGGSNYAKEIPAAIKNCRILVVVLSKKAQDSQWVPKEVDRAINERKIVMPFQIEDCELTDDFNFYLTNVQRYRAYESKEREIARLLTDIRAVLNAGEAPQPKPEPEPQPEPVEFRGSVFALSTVLDILTVTVLSVLFGNELLVKLDVQNFAVLSFWGFILTGTAAALFVNIKFRGVLFAKTYSWKKYLLFCLLSLVISILGSALYLLLIFLLILCLVLFGLRVIFGGDSRD